MDTYLIDIVMSYCDPDTRRDYYMVYDKKKYMKICQIGLPILLEWKYKPKIRTVTAKYGTIKNPCGYAVQCLLHIYTFDTYYGIHNLCVEHRYLPPDDLYIFPQHLDTRAEMKYRGDNSKIFNTYVRIL